MVRTSIYVLRLLTSAKTEAERLAAEEGTTQNQFINVAVAEKIAAPRTEEYFRERAGRADLIAFDRFLSEANDEPPRKGDEADSEWQA